MMGGACRCGLRVTTGGAPQSLPDNRLVRRPPGGHPQPDATSLGTL